MNHNPKEKERIYPTNKTTNLSNGQYRLDSIARVIVLDQISVINSHIIDLLNFITATTTTTTIFIF
jgi:hypothetical protein